MKVVKMKLVSGETGTSINDGGVVPGRGSSKAPQVDIQRNPYIKLKCVNTHMTIGSWNVRTMSTHDKLENVKREMCRMNISILGVSETRWKEEGDFYSGEYRVIHTKGLHGQCGVAVILDPFTSKCVDKINIVSERVLMIKLRGDPVDVTIIQVYMPTSACDDVDVEEIYDQLDELIKDVRGNEYLVVMGDWNAVVGEGEDGSEVGCYGLGKRNDRGERLVEFCQHQKLLITNKVFKQEKRRRYTWKMPGDRGRYQIDYIMVKLRYRNSVTTSHAYPGADIYSDHNLVMMKVNLKLKKIKSGRKTKKFNRVALEGDQGFKFSNDIEEELNCDQTTSTNVNEKWNRLKNIVTTSAKKNIGYIKCKKAKKPWINVEMIVKMDERRKWKNVNTPEGRKKYNQLNNELRRTTDQAREDWWDNECRELEEMDMRGRSDLVYNKVKELTGVRKKTKADITIRDSNGNITDEPEKVKERWKDYIEELYATADKPTELDMEPENEVDNDSLGPSLLRREIENALETMKDGKSEGVDEIPAEMWKKLGENGIQKLIDLCVLMYETGVWPDDFLDSIMLTLKKKANAIDCKDHRTISLIVHASKIILKILKRRVEYKANEFLGDDQFGFRKKCGTREAIGIMRTLGERCIEHNYDIHVCFIDYEKAFDRVNWKHLLKILKDIGVDWKDRRMIAALYMNQTAVVRLGDVTTDKCYIGRGVRQGCLLSPVLFNIYGERMIKDALENMDGGVVIGGKVMKCVRFADDTALLANCEEDLQNMMDSLNTVIESYGMRINATKTKVMKIARLKGTDMYITVNGKQLVEVSQYKYLGSIIDSGGRSTKDVRSRIGMGKQAFLQRRELLSNKLDIGLKKRLVKTLVWSVALYACETWTLKVDERKKIEAFEMWIWRHMLKIKWTDKMTNEKVLQLVGEKRALLDTIRDRQRKWMGHILRHVNLFRDVIEGRVEGKRHGGRPRIKMLDELKKGEKYQTLKTRAEDRENWRLLK